MKRERIHVKDCDILSKAYTFNFQDNGSIVISDNDGFFVEEELTILIINGLLKAIDTIDFDDIKNRNKFFLKRRNEQLFNNDNNIKVKVSKKNKGIIYFITDDSEYVKIGLTTNLKTRLISFQSTNPSVKIIHTLESNDIDRTEKLFHNYFDKKRFTGEWFKLDKNDIKYILSGKYTKEIMESIGGTNG